MRCQIDQLTPFQHGWVLRNLKRILFILNKPIVSHSD
jgi:hypothetical protein